MMAVKIDPITEADKGELDPSKLRDVPGWERAPVPVCMGGDARALTFCCKPGMPLVFASKCRRDAVLSRIGLSQHEFVRIKDAFSRERGWDCDEVCFGSLSYCCMRRRGCPAGRDTMLHRLYGESAALKVYFSEKRKLARLLLEAAERGEEVEHLLPLC
ncbi:MAG: hypothetical protein QF415_06150 [Candidatus Undinarchaeales archaeon]|jgi:predicted metal-binding transcription factor (methanogenesis marker protein 9)|nr:hypothetical protein [Candidatus Undinarchaeales archaeon]MDP7492485.1 hypothetical protein [Candidatus Undinarchaeales archaeon]